MLTPSSPTLFYEEREREREHALFPPLHYMYSTDVPRQLSPLLLFLLSEKAGGRSVPPPFSSYACPYVRAGVVGQATQENKPNGNFASYV